MARKQPLLALPLFLALITARPGHAVSVHELIDPRPNGWVLDHAGALSVENEGELNRLGERVKTETGAELAVVVVDTTDGVDAHRYALDLAKRWGLGDAQRDDGLLVFAALDDRAAEILLGDGIDSDANVRASERIMRDTMVPRFRAGDPEGAVLAGAKFCAEEILGLGAAGARQPLLEDPEPAQPDTPEPPPVVAPEAESDASADADGVPAATAWLVALAAALLGGGGWLAHKLTSGNKRCPRCRQPMIELDEAADDAHLSPGEQSEERVGSVNWRVWMCTACTEVVKRPRKRWFSGYAACPRCGARTKDESTTTLSQATYSHGGQVRIDERCAACSYSATYTRSTPTLTRPSSSRSSRSSSGRSSSGGRSSGGRSSGGRSSGGSFSGRGASGRW